MSNWKPIDQAPKDGSSVLVNDTMSGAKWAAAHWSAGVVWSGWVYDDDLMNDVHPSGPCPTAYFDLPEVDI